MQHKYMSRCSTHAGKNLVESLNEAKKEAVREMGFGGLSNFPAFDLPYEIHSWLAGRFDTQKQCFEVYGRAMEISAKDVEYITGFPCTGLDVKALVEQTVADTEIEKVLNIKDD